MFVTYLQIFSFLVLFSSGHEELFVHVKNVIIRNNLRSVLMTCSHLGYFTVSSYVSWRLFSTANY